MFPTRQNSSLSSVRTRPCMRLKNPLRASTSAELLDCRTVRPIPSAVCAAPSVGASLRVPSPCPSVPVALDVGSRHRCSLPDPRPVLVFRTYRTTDQRRDLKRLKDISRLVRFFAVVLSVFTIILSRHGSSEHPDTMPETSKSIQPLLRSRSFFCNFILPPHLNSVSVHVTACLMFQSIGMKITFKSR